MTFRKPLPYDCGIYSIVSPSGNMYIGSSNNIPKRWASHKRELTKQIHGNRILQNSWNKYEGSLVFNKLLVCEEKDLLVYEQQYLDFYKPSYNISPTADRPAGIKRTTEFKENLRKHMTGNKYAVGSYPSKETRKKLSAALIGNNRAIGNKGKPKSLEHRKNLSVAIMGHLVSEETRKKIGEASKRIWEARKNGS